MTIEEWTHQVDGTIQAVLLACTSMIATHPEKEKVLALLKALAEQAIDAPQDSPEIRARKSGMRLAVDVISTGVATAQLAVERKSSTPH